jgi:hypothetical protein
MWTVGRTIISRLVAAVAVPIVLAVLGLVGLEVSAGDHESLVAFMTEGLTGLGLFIGFIVYSMTHRAIDKKANPADAADRTIAVANAAAKKDHTTPPAASPVPPSAYKAT